MGCTTSAHYPPDTVTFQEIASDGDVTTRNTTTTAGMHDTNKTTTIVRFSEDNKDKADEMKSKTDMLRGDVMQRHQARLTRQKTMLEKQTKMALAVEDLANQALEDKERLSLKSRSRGTSRATSRTESPTCTRKLAAFKQEDKSESECDIGVNDGARVNS